MHSFEEASCRAVLHRCFGDLSGDWRDLLRTWTEKRGSGSGKVQRFLFKSASEERPRSSERDLPFRREDNRAGERSALGIMRQCCAQARQKGGKIRYG